MMKSTFFKYLLRLLYKKVKRMARKYLILFAVLSLCFFNLISSFLGEKGYFANKALQRQLIENEYQMDREEVELENLRIREEELSTEDGIRLAAINLGYQVDSDEVYVFQDDDEIVVRHVSSSKDSETTENKIFKPWKLGFILIVTLCSSATITILVWLMRGPEESEELEEDDDESSSEEEQP